MAKIKRNVLFLGIIAAGLLLYISCNETIEKPPVYPEITHDLEQVEGTQGADMTLNQGSAVGRDSWFEVELSGIDYNGIISNGATEGWCVEWDKSIAQQAATHNGVQIYSTLGKKRWKPLNYLLTIKDRLKMEDPDLTYREIQAAIWSVADGSDFDVDMPVSEMPPRLTKDGQPAFDKQKVKAIVNEVQSNATSYKYKTNGKHAVFIHSSDDQQTVTVPSDETVSHGYVEGVTPENIDSTNAERTYPVIEADWEGPGGDSRWLGMNLGATDAPDSFDDDSPESAGWYFQFQNKQGINQRLDVGIPEGYINQTATLSFDSDWLIENDPCTELLGENWRIPTTEEWNAVGEAEARHELNLHAAGRIDGTGAFGSGNAFYWSSTQVEEETAEDLFTDAFSFSTLFADEFETRVSFKQQAQSIRCIED